MIQVVCHPCSQALWLLGHPLGPGAPEACGARPEGSGVILDPKPLDFVDEMGTLSQINQEGFVDELQPGAEWHLRDAILRRVWGTENNPWTPEHRSVSVPPPP